jgi:hypothetical protein
MARGKGIIYPGVQMAVPVTKPVPLSWVWVFLGRGTGRTKIPGGYPCHSLGATQETTAPYTSAQNGQSERAHLTIMNKAHAMRLACGLPSNHWDKFARTAAYLTLRCPTSTLADMTPYEAYHGVKPNLSRLQEISSRTLSSYKINMFLKQTLVQSNAF